MRRIVGTGPGRGEGDEPATILRPQALRSDEGQYVTRPAPCRHGALRLVREQGRRGADRAAPCSRLGDDRGEPKPHRYAGPRREAYLLIGESAFGALGLHAIRPRAVPSRHVALRGLAASCMALMYQ